MSQSDTRAFFSGLRNTLSHGGGNIRSWSLGLKMGEIWGSPVSLSLARARAIPIKGWP